MLQILPIWIEFCQVVGLERSPSRLGVFKNNHALVGSLNLNDPPASAGGTRKAGSVSEGWPGKGEAADI